MLLVWMSGASMALALVGGLRDVDHDARLGQDGDVDAGADGDPVAELRAEPEGDAGDVEAVARAARSGAGSRRTARARRRRSPSGRESRARAGGRAGRRPGPCPPAGEPCRWRRRGCCCPRRCWRVGSADPRWRAAATGRGPSSCRWRWAPVDGARHVDAVGAGVQADVALHGQTEEPHLELGRGLGEQRGIEVGGRGAAREHARRDGITTGGRADDLEGAGGAGGRAGADRDEESGDTERGDRSRCMGRMMPRAVEAGIRESGARLPRGLRRGCPSAAARRSPRCDAAGRARHLGPNASAELLAGPGPDSLATERRRPVRSSTPPRSNPGRPARRAWRRRWERSRSTRRGASCATGRHAWGRYVGCLGGCLRPRPQEARRLSRRGGNGGEQGNPWLGLRTRALPLGKRREGLHGFTLRAAPTDAACGRKASSPVDREFNTTCRSGTLPLPSPCSLCPLW